MSLNKRLHDIFKSTSRLYVGRPKHKEMYRSCKVMES